MLQWLNWWQLISKVQWAVVGLVLCNEHWTLQCNGGSGKGVDTRAKKPPSDKIKEFNAEIITFSIGGKKVGCQLRDGGERGGLDNNISSFKFFYFLPAALFPKRPPLPPAPPPRSKVHPKTCKLWGGSFLFSTIKEQTKFRFKMCSIFTKIRWGLPLNSISASLLLVWFLVLEIQR